MCTGRLVLTVNTPEEGLRPVSSCVQRGRAARGPLRGACCRPAPGHRAQHHSCVLFCNRKQVLFLSGGGNLTFLFC